MGNVCLDSEEEKRRERCLRGYGRFKLRTNLNLEGYEFKSERKTEFYSNENYGKDIMNPYKNSSYTNNRTPDMKREPFKELTNFDYGPLSPKK